MEPFLLKPAYKDYLWGGIELKTSYGKQTELVPLAESWECSVHPDGPSVIASGPYGGTPLADFLRQHPQALGAHGAVYDGLPILLKLIDAEKNLSIQVHPDDQYAQKHEGQLGKTEMWYVLKARPGATLVYGFAHDVTPQLVREAIERNTLLEHLQTVPVYPGDVFLIEPGTIHAIGGGVLLAEVQESSNVTYRVYDYGRRDKTGAMRPLHMEQALSVMNFHAAPAVRQQQHIVQYTPGTARELVSRCRYFQVERIRTAGYSEVSRTSDTFYTLLVIAGRGMLEGEQAFPLKKGDTVFVPAAAGMLRLSGDLDMLLIKI